MIDYKIMELEDISFNAKRLSAKILINKEDGLDKEKLKNLIQHLVNELKNSDYAKENTRRRFGNKPYEVIYLFIYNDLRQANFGLPYCRVQWIDKNCKFKPMEITYDEIIGDGILLEWLEEYSFLEEMIKDNEIDKEEFLKRSDVKFKFLNDTYFEFKNLFARLISNTIDLETYKKEILKFEETLNKEYFEFIGFPESDVEGLKELYNYLQLAIADVHNILVVAKSKDYNRENVVVLTKIYLDEAIKNIDRYYVLRKKF